MSRLCEWMIQFVHRRRPQALNGYINRMAFKAAPIVVMKMLDAEGINHCAGCPKRFGMRKIDGRYFCESCAAVYQKNKEERARSAVGA